MEWIPGYDTTHTKKGNPGRRFAAASSQLSAESQPSRFREWKQRENLWGAWLVFSLETSSNQQALKRTCYVPKPPLHTEQAGVKGFTSSTANTRWLSWLIAMT